MKIGLINVDSKNFPNLPLMKISAYHKAKGDSVEWAMPFEHYDIVYGSKVFGDEYSSDVEVCYQADKYYFGGTGYAISVVDGKEVYTKEKDHDLPEEIEHMYPDYDLFPELTKDTAYGFLTRGCPNNCPFCIVSKKEGRMAKKVADLSEFWRGQKNIYLMDANLLACKDRIELLQQLKESKAKINFAQGLDARFVNEEIATMLKSIKIDKLHFAWDLMKNSDRIREGLDLINKLVTKDVNKKTVYILTNYDTTFEEDWYRVSTVREIGCLPDVRIYRKDTAPQITKDLQRWCNNRILYKSTDFFEYVPRKDGKTVRELIETKADYKGVLKWEKLDSSQAMR